MPLARHVVVGVVSGAFARAARASRNSGDNVNFASRKEPISVLAASVTGGLASLPVSVSASLSLMDKGPAPPLGVLFIGHLAPHCR